MDTSYLKLVSDMRIKNYLGLVMDEGYTFSRPKVADSDYAYIDIPIKGIVSDSGEVVREAKRNQSVYVMAACRVNVRGRSIRFEVHPNMSFWQFGATQGMYYLEPGCGELTPGFSIVLRRDLNLDELDPSEHCVRIYMRQ